MSNASRVAGRRSTASITQIHRGRGLKKSDMAGKVDGNAFDWNEQLYYDPTTGALTDTGELDARLVRDALRADWKMRQLELALCLPIKGATWKLVPGAGPQGAAIATDTEEKLRRDALAGGMKTPIGRVIGQMTSAFAYRRAYFAKGFTLDPVRNDGSVMYSQLAMRPATNCRILLDPDSGEYAGFEQSISQYFGGLAGIGKPGIKRSKPKGWNGLPIPFYKHKAMTFVYGMDRAPVTGMADLEIAYWCYRTKQKLLYLLLDWAQSAALPRTSIGHKGDVEQAKAAATQIARVKNSGVVYYDANNLDVATLDVSGKGGASFMQIITYLDSCAAGSVLASFADLANGSQNMGRGSYAMSESQEDFFMQTRESAAQEIGLCLTEQAVAPLVRFNYGHQAPLPTFTFDPIAGVSQEPIIGLLTALAAAPQTQLPSEFIMELALSAARLLNLDVGKIAASFTSAAYLAQQAARTAPPVAQGNPAAQAAGPQVAAIHAVVQKAAQISGTAKPKP